MSRLLRVAAIVLPALMLFVSTPTTSDAQGRGGAPRGGAPRGGAPPVAAPGPRVAHPVHPGPSRAVRGPVFVGGYFYDPFWGPYPWWGHGMYPYWYYPVFDDTAHVRLRLEPNEVADPAAVYVDGFYAGVVEDFDGVFQGMPLTPGGHKVVIFLEGYRTIRENLYLSPGSSYSLKAMLEHLPPGVASERPEVAPPVPAPPEGSYQNPVTPQQLKPKQARGLPANGFGTIDLFVQPQTAKVKIDGQPWDSSEEGHFLIEVPIGKHHIEVSSPGFRSYTTNVEVPEGQSRQLNVSLMGGGTH